MTLIRKLASVLLLASWLTSGSTNSQDLIAGQIYNTQNLTNNSPAPSTTTGAWQNVGLWNQGLPCWQPGGPVYCGPKPYFNNGSVNFSYGTTDLNQVVNIANALPNTGTGLLVNGFRFGFTAKNGNGWDNGMQDYLAAYVKLYGPDGKVTASYDYSSITNRKYNWTTFNFNETFDTPYATKDLAAAQYGFVGRDNNGWAGPYGPEITNINFSLKYSVDPCVKDPLYSPTCPGFLDALNKKTGTLTAYTGDLPVTQTETTVVSVTTSTTSVNPTTATTTSTAVTASAKPTAVSSATTSFALNLIAKNSANIKATQDKAASDAISAATSAATATVDQAQSIALTQSQASVSSADKLQGSVTQSSGPLPGATASTSLKSTVGPSVNSSAGTLSLLSPPVVQVDTVSTNISNLLTPVGLATAETKSTPTKTTSVAAGVQTISTAPTSPISLLLPPVVESSTTAPIAVVPVAAAGAGLSISISDTPFALTSFMLPNTPVTEAPKFSDAETSRNIDMSSPTDFVAGYLNTKHTLGDMQTSISGPAVNSKTQDNEAAGGVSIAAMATMPKGYDLYTQLMLKDSTFYKPEELYKGQKTVDNARAQRLLQGASDRLHQEMVDSQYNK